MPKWSSDAVRAAPLAAMLMALALAAPATAEIYAWRTEDGVFAYTDDPSRIPARYADQAVRVEDTRLENYARLTRTDPEATRAVAARMEKRLEYLRRLNGLDATAARSEARGLSTGNGLTLAGGATHAPLVNFGLSDGSGPVVLEPVRTKQAGRAITRHTTIVKQGGRVVAILKGDPTDFNPNRDIYDEDDLAD